MEVQWKGRRCHPYGWWFGTVQSVRGNRVVLLFRWATPAGPADARCRGAAAPRPLTARSIHTETPYFNTLLVALSID